MKTQLSKKFWNIVSLALVLSLVFAPVAFADNVQNDVETPNEIITITAGSSTTVNYLIKANNGDGQNGCNAEDNTPATVTINVPAGVTAFPGSLSFTSCDTLQSVVFSSSSVGEHEITVSVSDTGPGTYNPNPAKFKLIVNTAPPPSDTTPPSITITTPAVGGAYTLNEDVKASYSCADETGGSGLKTCVGTVANGAALDTSSVGVKTFTVNAEDNAGNTSIEEVSYTVNYGVCALYDQSKSHKSGSTVPIKLQLCDANGVNYSSSGIVLNAAGLSKIGNSASAILAEDSGNANPDSNFRYSADLEGYIFNLSTKSLTTGTWKLSFKVGGVTAGAYSVEFMVK